MRLIARPTLREFYEQPGRSDARAPLLAWARAVEKADWRRPIDIRNMVRSADFVGDDRVVFNVGGNKYRLVVRVHYVRKIVWVKFVGTHAEYDQVNVREL